VDNKPPLKGVIMVTWPF